MMSKMSGLSACGVNYDVQDVRFISLRGEFYDVQDVRLISLRKEL